MKKIFLLLSAVFISLVFAGAQPVQNGFYGMWSIHIENGAVGWLKVYDNDGVLDADLLWQGGSVLPVQSVFLLDENNLVVMRAGEATRTTAEGQERKVITPHLFEIARSGDRISGKSVQPARNGMQANIAKFYGWKLPDLPPAPDLSLVKYGKPVNLFNGKDLTGWKLTNSRQTNGFKVEKGVLVNDPVQQEGRRISYGNIRTEQEFEDFNLTLEVNVPAGSNSGVYLRGMYEIQVMDSYGRETDSHNMGAVYSRVKPTVAAEKPAGEWQAMDITLCDRHITVRLNGTTIIDNQPVYGPTGGALSGDVLAPGPIYLQGDHGKVSYRNMVLRAIEK